jgi:hypothetical protein
MSAPRWFPFLFQQSLCRPGSWQRLVGSRPIDGLVMGCGRASQPSPPCGKSAFLISHAGAILGHWACVSGTDANKKKHLCVHNLHRASHGCATLAWLAWSAHRHHSGTWVDATTTTLVRLRFGLALDMQSKFRQ